MATYFSCIKGGLIAAVLTALAACSGTGGSSSEASSALPLSSSSVELSSSSFAPASSSFAMSSSSVAVVSSLARSSSSIVFSSSIASSSSSAAALTTLVIEEQQTGYCAGNGVIESEHGGFAGAGYSNTDNATDTRISWRVNATEAGNATLKIRFANGSTTNRDATVTINDGTVATLPVQMAMTGAWTAWQDLTLSAALVAGPNVIELSSQSIDGLANVDSLSVTAANIKVENCFTNYATSGQTPIHDPSTILKDNGVYWTYGTEQGIPSRFSYDLKRWHIGPTVFTPGTWPSWITPVVTKFEGMFWAPDIIKMNGRFYIYYTAFKETGNANKDYAESAIGVAVTDSLNNPNWQDLGMVVSSTTHPRNPKDNGFVNTIDAGVYRDKNNNVWMVYGSHFGGLYTAQINPATGKTLNSTRIAVAGTVAGWTEYEAAQVQFINGYYYLFVNLGDCCAGNKSNYLIVVGRSASPSGPFITEGGHDLRNADLISQKDVVAGVTTGATLATQGTFIGPGHFGYLNNYGQNLASIHYYDGTTLDGWPARLEILKLDFVNGWPKFSRGFKFVAEPTTITAYDTLINGGSYRIKPSSATSLALDLSNCSATAGTNVGLWNDLDNTCQQWHITKTSGSNYKITSAVDINYALTVVGSAATNNVSVANYTGTGLQQFKLQKTTNKRFNIITSSSNKCLTIENNSTTAGANVVEAACNGADNQAFLLD